MVSKKKEVLRKLSYYLVLEVIIVILAEIQFFLGSNFLGSNMYYVVMCARVRKLLGF